ncbi:hemerythrin family protein [Sulfurimonas sp. SAG-AH-194-I05]|nr:hemerythrin family protein [Sulfurimonas sp. SAG-AH-194-I05]MDF1874873.1 hemerythrin family protein [Sulfurimonas sp. SAG-AH-194-I05]
MGLLYAEQVEYMSVEEMQETHENEIQILNDIDKLATKHQLHKTEPDALIAKIDEYIVHVKKHFANEERLMQKYNFPSYHMHKTAHDMFLEDLDYALKQWKRSDNIEKITNFIRKTPEWIVLHVNSVDAPTANFLAAKMKE